MGLCLIKALSQFKEFELKAHSMCLRYGNDTISNLCDFDPLKTLEGELIGVAEYKDEITPYLLYE